MLMLSLNKYFIRSVYTLMLWDVGDVSELVNVNFMDVLKISDRAALFTAVTALFDQRHLLSDSGVTLSFILSAARLQINATMGATYCCKSLPVDEKQAILLRIYFIVLKETFMDFYHTNKTQKRWYLTAEVCCVFR